jgi:hypothetical protein
MSEQPPRRQLSPEEAEYLKSKTRSNNFMTWFAGLGIGGMILVGGATLLTVCGVIGCCVFVLYTISQVPPR